MKIESSVVSNLYLMNRSAIGVTLHGMSKNDLLKDRLRVCIAKSASMGAANVFEVLHSPVEVAVLNKVIANFHSVAVRDLRARVAHRLGKQEVCPGK